MATPAANQATLSALIRGSIVVTDRFADAPDEVAFRTLVTIDGDLCMSIAARALSLPDFGEQLAAHGAHVKRSVESQLSLARNLIGRLSTLIGASGPVAYIAARLSDYGPAGGLEQLAARLAEHALRELAGLALATLLGLALRAAARALIQTVLRRGLGKIGAPPSAVAV